MGDDFHLFVSSSNDSIIRWVQIDINSLSIQAFEAEPNDMVITLVLQNQFSQKGFWHFDGHILVVSDEGIIGFTMKHYAIQSPRIDSEVNLHGCVEVLYGL